MTQTKIYDDIEHEYYGPAEEVAQFRATWPNGNEPDGEGTVVIKIYGSDTDGWILVCDDDGAGGSSREAGETVYPSRDDATTAAVAYAAAHDESTM